MSIKKYIAYFSNHDWEGMRRERESEAHKDLQAHKDLFSNEPHQESGVKIEEISKNEKLLLKNDDHKAGSTHAKCDRKGCNFHRGIDSFTVGKDRVRVKIKAIPDGVIVNNVTLKNSTGRRDYVFSGQDVSRLGGTSQLVNKGDYRIIPSYGYVDTGGPRMLTLFVHW